MDINSLLKEHKIAICVEFDVKDKKYTLYKNNMAGLSSYYLFNELIIYSDYSYLESIKDEELLPKLWAQGDIHCCIFPVKSGNVVCLFFESDMNVSEFYTECQKYMELFQQI